MQDLGSSNNNATGNSSLISYVLHLADSTLILSQRNSEWCGHGPILEQDIAITNISLDLLGQARNFYQYAATLIGGTASEDSLAYLRKEREFKWRLGTNNPSSIFIQPVSIFVI
jgi:ring-1,2-phenylacetyl-CoA epoxidase subunit PaaC